jgi:hypothetical protein
MWKTLGCNYTFYSTVIPYKLLMCLKKQKLQK